jgi:hypothetical protein
MPPNRSAVIGNEIILDDHFYTDLRNSTACLVPLFAAGAPPFHMPHPDLKRPLTIALTPFWVHSQYIYLSFVPVGDLAIIFDSTLLKCLSEWSPHQDPTKMRIGHSRSQDKWTLAKETARKWYELEKCLHTFIEAVEEVMPTDFSKPRPGLFLYRNYHDTQDDAIKAVGQAHRTFLFLLGRVTYALCSIKQWAKAKEVVWQDVVHDKSKSQLHFHHIAGIETSICGDLTAPRLGGIHHMLFVRENDMVLMQDICAPTYAYWGPNPADHSSSSSFPSPPDVGIVNQLRVELQRSSPPPPPPSTLAQPSFQPLKGTGQQPGEHFREFFKRRSTKNEWTKASEWPRDRLARLDRLNNAKLNTKPGRSNTVRVFHWEKNEDGHYIRTPLTKGQWDWCWSSEYRNKRRYDSFANEWDYCTDFDPEDCMPPGGYEDDYDHTQDSEYEHNPLPPLRTKISTFRPHDFDDGSDDGDDDRPVFRAPPAPTLPVWKPSPRRQSPPSSAVSPTQTRVAAPWLVAPDPQPSTASVVSTQCPRGPQTPPLPSYLVLTERPRGPQTPPLPPSFLVSTERPHGPKTPPLSPSSPIEVDAVRSSRSSSLPPSSPVAAKPEDPWPSTPPALDEMDIIPEPKPSALSIDPPMSPTILATEMDVDVQITLPQLNPIFPDHGLSPSQLAHAKYGLNSAMIASNHLPAAQNSDRCLYLGKGHLDKSSWGSAHELQELNSQFHQLLSVSMLDNLALNVTDLQGAAPLPTIGNHLRLTHALAVDDKRQYFLTDAQANLDNPQLALKLSSALVVCEIFRRGWDADGLQGVARELSCRAIPFVPCVRNPTEDQISQHPPTSLTVVSSLGYRPKAYMPDALDFQAYTSLLDEFFNSSRAQLALHHGGLITRIALDYIDLETASLFPDLTSASDFAFGGDAHYFFNVLTPEEKDFICGTYYVSTGQLNQYSHLSWWPSHRMWESSYFHLGFWTLDAEAYYLEKQHKGHDRALSVPEKARNTLGRTQRQIVRDYGKLEDQACRVIVEKY